MKKLSLLILIMLSISSCCPHHMSKKPYAGQCYISDIEGLKIRECHKYGCIVQYWHDDDQKYEGTLYYRRFNFFNKKTDCLDSQWMYGKRKNNGKKRE